MTIALLLYVRGDHRGCMFVLYITDICNIWCVRLCLCVFEGVLILFDQGLNMICPAIFQMLRLTIYTRRLLHQQRVDRRKCAMKNFHYEYAFYLLILKLFLFYNIVGLIICTVAVTHYMTYCVYFVFIFYSIVTIYIIIGTRLYLHSLSLR